MDYSNLAEKEFRTAQTMAAWSFAGIIIPVLGIILGVMALSKLRGLVANNPDDEVRMHRTRLMAYWGVGVTIALTAIISLVWAWLYLFVIPKYSSQSTIGNSAGMNVPRDYSDRVRQNFISACQTDRETCVCSFNALSERYTFPQFLEIDSYTTLNGQLPPDAIETIKAAGCVGV